jgi:hypothetical protein
LTVHGVSGTLADMERATHIVQLRLTHHELHELTRMARVRQLTVEALIREQLHLDGSCADQLQRDNGHLRIVDSDSQHTS